MKNYIQELITTCDSDCTKILLRWISDPMLSNIYTPPAIKSPSSQTLNYILLYQCYNNQPVLIFHRLSHFQSQNVPTKNTRKISQALRIHIAYIQVLYSGKNYRTRKKFVNILVPSCPLLTKISRLKYIFYIPS